MWTRLFNWRLWLLVGVALVDGLFFIIPLVACALVVTAVIAPHLLRRVARFLDATAAGGGA